MDYSSIKFSGQNNVEFFTTLRSRVMEYFKENNITRYGNSKMVIKTIALIAMYFVPYFLMIFGVFSSLWIQAGLWVIMGFGMAGIGFSVMHDANHGAYSKNATVNKILGLFANILGASATNWKIQHNMLHHSYTNVSGIDEDISPGNIMRFSPHQKRFKAHRFQHLYAWFLYALMTIQWSTVKDFRQIFRYKRMGLTKKVDKNFSKLFTHLMISKIIYYGYLIVLPIVLTDTPWYFILLFYALMHFVAGFILAVVFQPAHVIPSSEFPLPDITGKLDNNWAVHQMLTTSNFAPKNKLLSWYVGGLNFQIEHHLFPNICHVHYKKLSKIVKKTADEFNVPYNVQPTFRAAIAAHGKLLKEFGTGVR